MATREPNVVKFGFTEFKLVNERKWSAKCNHCNEVITESRGTSSGFTKHLERKHTTVYDGYKKSKGRLIHEFDVTGQNRPHDGV